VAEASSGFPKAVPVSFSGPVDLVLRETLADDVSAVVRELLTNAARHSRADQVRISVAVDASWTRVVVADDGIGIPEDGRRSGLDNLRVRAERRGGTLLVDSAPGSTTVEWRVPAPSEADAMGGGS
jgi:signal transduction histidine kinase